MYGPEQVVAFAAEAGFLVVTAALTPRSRGLLGRAALRAMRPGAFSVCVSRGGIADNAALLTALQEGWIAGAGLDAHAVEPLPADSPFWSLPNVIVTPHNGATTAGTQRRGVDVFVANLRRFVDGQPLTNVVDKAAGHRRRRIGRNFAHGTSTWDGPRQGGLAGAVGGSAPGGRAEPRPDRTGHHHRSP